MRIFVDTDPGIDDAVALAYLAAQPDVDIVGVGSVFGNNPIEVTTDNALRLLRLFGRPEVPVAKGAARGLVATPLFAEEVHGGNGLGGVEIPPTSDGPVAESAAETLVRLARAAPGEISLLTLGTLTNIALALMLEPELPRLLGRVVIMGGAVTCPGNTTPWTEANVVKDPEAAERVLSAGFDATLVALDVTMRTLATEPWLAELAGARSQSARYCSRFLEFYVSSYSQRLKRRACPIHDALAAGILLDPSLVTEALEVPVRVELRGEHTRGMTIADLRPDRVGDERPVVRVATEVGSDLFLKRLLDALR